MTDKRAGRNRILTALIALMLIVVAAIGGYLYGHGKAEIPEEEELTPSTERTPVAVICDYDTEDAERVQKYMKKAGFDVERVGLIEDLDVAKYEAMVIPGGHSVTPSMYGAERHPKTKDTDIDKDRFQFAAVQMFIEAEKPVLGICRGEQLINNVLGGTTIQHMDEGWHKEYMTVRIAEGTWLYDLLGTEASTYHYHHQCVDELGDGLYATQWDPESGHIEAYEHKFLPVYGLQWHPDSMDDKGVKVFEEFRKVVEEYIRGESN